MYRRISVFLLTAIAVAGLAACHNKKVQNPIANLNSKQPDKVLFDRAMDAMKHNKFDVARMTLQTMINAYPDSEFVARAKLAIGDSWFAEGGSAGLAQAESEYKDFITFFPNMPESAEAQMKVANIHFSQMEKSDRDFTHAKRAEEEYRAMILNYPDSKLVPDAKAKLREVQEVLAEREFLIGRFYYLRESWPASIARLKSVADTYPLFSGADEALFLLGDSYERQLAMLRANAPKMGNSPEAQQARTRLEKSLADHAADAYSRIVTRYPVTERATDAKARLQAMHRPVPAPTQQAIAQNKAEEESRLKTGMWGRTMLSFRRHPDMAQATRVGDPTLVDPKPTSAPEIVRQSMEALTGAGANKVSVEQVGGAPAANQPPPRSDSANPNSTANPNSAPAKNDPNAIPELTPMNSDPSGSSGPAAGNGDGSATGSAAGSGGSAVGSADPGSPASPPPQVNDAPAPDSSQAQSGQTTSSSDPSQSDSQSSSKTKKKKGLKKLNPF